MEIFSALPGYSPFVGFHRSPVNSPHKGQWCGALMFPLICARTNGWVNHWDAGNLRHHRAHYHVTVMWPDHLITRSVPTPWKTHKRQSLNRPSGELWVGCPRWATGPRETASLKRKHHFDEIVTIGCTESCPNGNFSMQPLTTSKRQDFRFSKGPN